MGIMFSSFCSHDVGYNFTLIEDQLSKVNNYREGKDYIDEEAAMEVTKKIQKQPLKHSPFERKFEYHINLDSYWNYQHNIIQFKDKTDMFKALFGKRFQFIVFFDHSSGHKKLRHNSLNANSLNKFHAGKQNTIKNSQIEDEAYLGPFQHKGKLKVGDL